MWKLVKCIGKSLKRHKGKDYFTTQEIFLYVLEHKIRSDQWLRGYSCGRLWRGRIGST